MYKFRTMHVNRSEGDSRITAARDPRIFGWGRLLRKSKLDELPQLLNVVAGEMSVVGPRPEDISIVRDHYSSWMHETLSVRPGMASPGSLYGSMYDYHRDEEGSSGIDPEEDYLVNLLPIKLAVELVYVRHASFWYDMRVILRTIKLITMVAVGKRTFIEQPEYSEAISILQQQHS